MYFLFNITIINIEMINGEITKVISRSDSLDATSSIVKNSMHIYPTYSGFMALI